MESAAISSDIEQLEAELSGLRARVDEDSSSFASLEEQVASLKVRLSETQDAVRSREAALEEKRAQLAEAQRLERLAAYDEDLAQYREARDRVEKAGDRFLAEAEAYDGEVLRIRKLRSEMLDAFGDDERTDEIDAALDEDANGLTSTWKAVVGAAEWRLRSVAKAAGAATAPAAKPANGGRNGDDPPADEGRASRILEYFNKS